MIRVHRHCKVLIKGLLTGGVLISMSSLSALAQATTPVVGENPTYTMAPIPSGAEITPAIARPSRAHTADTSKTHTDVAVPSVAVNYPPVKEGIYAQAVEQQFTSGLAGVSKEVEHVYRMNGMAPLWFSETGASPFVGVVTDILARAGEHGLNPTHYSLPIGVGEGTVGDPQETASNDLALSRVVFAYLSDVRLGVLRPGIRNRDTILVAKIVDMAALFGRVASNPEQGLKTAPPSTEAYRNLIQLLAVARADQANGEWGNVRRKGGSLKPGRKDRRVPQIAARLVAGGEFLPPVDADLTSLVYTPDLVEAVKTFQARHGVGVDGVAGRRTIDAMNITAEQRVEQVIANLERERWQPEAVPDRMVEVNVPAFHLVAKNSGIPVLDMDVIVGRSKRPTPIFSDNIRFVEFNPTWTVPKKLAAEDIGPQAMKDPGYLARKGFKIYSSWKRGAVVVDPTTINWQSYNKYNIPFRIVQAPGKKNSLGSVKFLFPNKFAVYLHDTPAKGLFRKAIRSFSSGCVRVADPRAFTSYLLSSQLEEGQIDKAFARKRTRRVTLDSPVAVRLIYRTAWLGENGEAQYRADIYGRDRQVIRQLREKGLGL